MQVGFWTIVAVGIWVVFAEESLIERDEINGATGPNNATTPIAREGDITIHYVTVGEKDNVFMPNSIVAEVGDIVSFQFYPLNHSVIRAAYLYPCIPIEDVDYGANPFYSGFFPIDSVLDNPPTWNLTIDHTDPIFYYCGRPGSCTDWGMVGAINANANTSLVTQIKLAREADYMLVPGGTFPTEKVEASLSRLAHSATIATQHGTMAASPQASASEHSKSGSHSTSRISSAAVAGVAIGAAAFALILAALFFLMYRTRSLKRKLELKDAASKIEVYEEAHSPSQYPDPGNHISSIRQHSESYPYHTYYHLRQPDVNNTPSVQSLLASNGSNASMGFAGPQSHLECAFQPVEIAPLIQAQRPIYRDSQQRQTPAAAELDTPRYEMN